jgi:hypothetical protein
MMAKLGKYSTGTGGKEPMMRDFGGNKGYSARENMMGDNGLTKHEKTSLGGRHTATGNRVLVKDKDVKRKT